MDSINRNQTEENHADLSGYEAVDQIRAIVKKAQTCFFCTALSTGGGSGARPMSVQQVDNDGNLWFLSANDSVHDQELAADPAIQLMFQGSQYSDFLNVYGKATISADKAKIKELWNPMLKTWFTEGVDDPRISVIKVTPTEGYYWDTKHNMAVGFIKRLVGAAIGV